MRCRGSRRTSSIIVGFADAQGGFYSLYALALTSLYPGMPHTPNNQSRFFPFAYVVKTSACRGIVRIPSEKLGHISVPGGGLQWTWVTLLSQFDRVSP